MSLGMEHRRGRLPRSAAAVLAAAFASFLSGCGTKFVVVEPLQGSGPYVVAGCQSQAAPDDARFCTRVRDHVAYRLFKAGLLAPEGAPGREVSVYVTGMRDVNTVSRVAFGAMTGTESVYATVVVRDPVSQAELGRADVGSYNTSALNSTPRLFAMEIGSLAADFLLGTRER